jgi:hypothetical protein
MGKKKKKIEVEEVQTHLINLVVLVYLFHNNFKAISEAGMLHPPYEAGVEVHDLAEAELEEYKDVLSSVDIYDFSAIETVSVN